MSEYLTEEQQVEAFKRWWNDNGNFVIGAVFVSLGLYAGATFWKSSQETKAHEASASYDKLVELVDAKADKQSDEIATVANNLIENDRDGLYADLASFHLAKAAVEASDFDAAAAQFSRVISDSSNEASVQLAKLRLAKVRVAQGQHDEALKLLKGKRAKSFEGAYSEARGDIHLSQGQLDEARSAYQAALTAIESEQGQTQRSSVIRYKLDSARVATVNPLEVPSVPTAAEPKQKTGPEGGVADSAGAN